MRLSGWIRTQEFVLSYWGFSFGLAALGWCMLSVARAGTHGAIEYLALPVFVVENIVIVMFLLLTLRSLVRPLAADCQMLERMP